MKPTSIIFLVMSVILFLGGFAMCKYAIARAQSEGFDIYSQRTDENGDQVFRYGVDDNAISSLKLTFSDVDVTIEPTTSESCVVLTNFPVKSYSASLNGSSVSVDGTTNLLYAMIDRSDGGLKFKGLRYFLMEDPSEESKRSVHVYINKFSKLNSVSVSVTNGSISISGLDNPLDYTLNVKNGNIDLKDICTVSVAKVNIQNGAFTGIGCDIYTLRCDIENGSARINSNGKYDAQSMAYNLSSENGSIIYNGAILEENTYRFSPASVYSTTEVKVSDGSITVNDSAE